MLFQEAFGHRVLVGIIAVSNPDYDTAHWWRSSEGVREIISEVIAYVYARAIWLPMHRLSRIHDRYAITYGALPIA
jgi:hypothetical protein